MISLLTVGLLSDYRELSTVERRRSMVCELRAASRSTIHDETRAASIRVLERIERGGERNGE